MKNLIRHTVLASLVAFALAAPATALAAPGLPPAGPAVSSVVATDAPTKRALELQRSIDEVQAEQISIDNRIAVTSRMVVEQTAIVDQATAQLKAAQDVYDERVVAMYKTGDEAPFAILLSASSFEDFVRRLTLFTSVLEADRTALEELSVIAAQAQFQAGQLDALGSLETTLKGIKGQRDRSLAAAVAAQQALLASLPTTSRALITQYQNETAANRAVWRAATVPIGTTPRRVTARVDSRKVGYAGSQYHYRSYSTTGKPYETVASWYGAAYDGMTTASSELFNATDYTCASPTLPFGTWLALTRTDPLTKIKRRVIVVVNDRGPYASGRGLDLSRRAAGALGMVQSGVSTLTVEVVKPTTN